MVFEEQIDKLFSLISQPFNKVLDIVPTPFLRPIIIVALSYVIAISVSGRMDKFKWIRRVFLTAVFYLAFSAIGIK